MSKRIKEAVAKIDKTKVYAVVDAVEAVKASAKVKFDPSIELHVNLTIDPKKTDQSVRANVSLPHGTGKTVRIAAFVADNEVSKAKAAGADIAGADDLIESIKQSEKCDFDVAVATPEIMKKLAAIARILGQKGLMPNPKTGTIAPDVTKIIGELKKGKVSFKNDAGGVIHVACGKASFPSEHLVANIQAFMDAIKAAKPDSIKGTFIRSVYLTSSMGPSVKMAI